MPVLGALVLAIRIEPEVSVPAAAVRSDQAGRYRIDGLAAGRYAVTATAPGLAAGRRSGLAVRDRETLKGVGLSLSASGVIVSGKIRDSQGKAVAGAAVLATRSSPEPGDIYQTVAGPDGSYAVKLPRGHYTFRTHAEGLASESIRLEGRDERLDLTLDARAEAELPAPSDLLDWLRGHAVPLKTVEAGNGFEDMRLLKSLVGEARVVALGEATHGTREFFQFKHRMLEFLAEEMGFTLFAIEGNWPESLAINEYVVNGEGDPAQTLARMYPGTWNTEEVLDMIRWMRWYDADPRHIKKLKFLGFDMQVPFGAVASVLDYLRRVDPGAVAEVSRTLAPFRRYAPFIAYPRRGADYRKSIADGLSDLLRRFEREKRVYISRSSEAEWVRAEQMARTVWQAEQCRTALPSRSPRDRFMAENARGLLNREGEGARMMLWAHNGHISFDTGTYRYKPMGAFLKEAYGRAYVALGFAFNRGSFRARRLSSGPPETWPPGTDVFSVGPARETSVDATLSQAGIPLFALDLRLVPSDGPIHGWWRRRHPARSIGGAYSEPGGDAYYIEQVPADSYDGLIFVEKTRASRPNQQP